jgi:hypothetical protein
MEAVRFLTMSVSFYQPVPRHIPEGSAPKIVTKT